MALAFALIVVSLVNRGVSMDEKIVVMLIDYLFSGSTDEQKRRFTELYREAFTKTEEYSELESLINNNRFYPVEGKMLYDQGNDAVINGMTSIGKYSDYLASMRHVINSIKKILQVKREMQNSVKKCV